MDKIKYIGFDMDHTLVGEAICGWIAITYNDQNVSQQCTRVLITRNWLTS